MTTLDTGVTGILVALAIFTGLSAAYGVIVVRTFLHGHYDTVRLRQMLRYGVPLIPGMADTLGHGLCRPRAARRHRGLGTVGLYAIASRFAAPVSW